MVRTYTTSEPSYIHNSKESSNNHSILFILSEEAGRVLHQFDRIIEFIYEYDLKQNKLPTIVSFQLGFNLP